ncbi:uncharacterized protein LOC123499881 [Portunus trituberculatus]|uniref:uncharacterized protein LOC123499881 n=1 Tax=Portunus trituberculatus TaxID=210409 RepID=UPI001E1CC45F|nr:uncharacterized protein LOC123499881 [Portunus trituberculatus]
MEKSRWILPWLLVLSLLTAADGGNYSRSARESGFTGESTLEGVSGLSGSSVSRVWRTVRTSASANEEKAKLYLVKQLLKKAEDLIKPYISATTAMNVTAGTVTKLEHSGDASDAGSRQWHLGTVLSQFDISFFNSNTSVDVVSQVEELLSIGLGSAQKMYMTEWRDRLILAIIEASGVSLYAIEPKTHRIQRTEGPKGRLSCNFAHVAGGHLVLTCIMADETKHHEELRMVKPTLKKVKVFMLSEKPMTPGRGPLTYRFVHDIDVDSPRYIETWYQNKKTFSVIISGEVIRSFNDQHVHFTRHTTSALYCWIGNHFDNWELLPGNNPVAAHHFMVNEFHYLAFANFQNNKGQHNCHSMIFRYYVDHGRYMPFQTVETRGACHLQSFTVGSKRFQHTFLAIANFCEDTNTGVCNPDTISTIYHFEEGKFKLFQEIETSHAFQWMAVQVNMTVLLALVSKKGVTFYQYNGWRFVTTAVQPSRPPFSVGVTSLASAFWDGRLVFGVTNADSDKAAGYPSLYSVSFTSRDDLEEAYYQLKESCEGLRRQAYGRELAELVQQVTITPRTTEPHNFSRRVTIKGNLKVESASQASEAFSQGRRIPNSGGQIEARIGALEGTIEETRRRLNTLLPAAGPVAWPAHLHLANLSSADTQVCSVGELKAVWINGQRAPVLRNTVPLHAATRLGNIAMEYIEFKAPVFVNHLHGKPISTYITLSGHHETGGNFIFQGPIRVQKVMVSNTLDGLQVDPRSLLLTTHAQTHEGSLKCQSLHSNILNVAVVNDIALDKLLSNLITRRANVTITGQLKVMGDIVHNGHLRAKDTRNLDLTNPLLTNSLQEQVVFGDHQMREFEAPSMTIEGRLNAVRVPAQVFLNGSHHSYTVALASFSHVRATYVSILQNLNSITVTEGDLDVLKLSGYQIVTAPKSFTSLQLLEQNARRSRSANTRHRRWSIGTCGSLKNRRPRTAIARIEALLLALRGVAAAQDLLSFLTEVQPGHFLVPLRTQLLFTLLKVDVNCAFIFLEDTERLMFFDIMTEDWRSEDKESVLVLSHQDLEKMVIEVMNYEIEMTNLLHTTQYRWFDVWLLLSKALRKVDDIHDSLNVVRLLIDLIVSDDTMTLNNSHHCQSVCGVQKDDEPLTLKCTRAALLTLRVTQRIARYPVLGSGMSQLSETQRMTFLKGAVQHDLGRLVEFLSNEEGLLPAVRAALPCGMVSLRRVIDNEQDLLKMLEQYEKELLLLSTYRDEQNDTLEEKLASEISTSRAVATAEEPITLTAEQASILTAEESTTLSPRGRRPLTPRETLSPRGRRPLTPRETTSHPEGDDPLTPEGDDPLTPRRRPSHPEGDDLSPRGRRPSHPEGDDPLTPEGDDPLTPRETTPRDDPLTPEGDDPLTPEGDDPLTPEGDDPLTPEGDDPEQLFTEQPYTARSQRVSTLSSHRSFMSHSLESSLDDSFPTYNPWSVQSPHTATPALPWMYVDTKLEGQTDSLSYEESHTFKYDQNKNSNGSISTLLGLKSEDRLRLKRGLSHNVLMVVSPTGKINSFTEISLGQQNSQLIQAEYFSNLLSSTNVVNGYDNSVSSAYTPDFSFNNEIPALDTNRGAFLDVPRNLSKRQAKALVPSSAIHDAGLVKGNTGYNSHVTTVTLVQHLTTIINCTSCTFHYQMFQTTANQNHASSAYPSASTVTHKTLTIMMSSSSTRIDCINCAFQCQIFTTQQAQAGWVPSSVLITRSEIIDQGSSTVKFPSSIPGPSYKFPHRSTSSIQPTPYNARTFVPSTATTAQSLILSVSSQLPWTISSSESEFIFPQVSVEPSQEPSSFTSYIPSRQSEEKCDNIPEHYYDYYGDPVQRDALLAWLEAAYLYFEEIQSISPMVISEQFQRKPVRTEATSVIKIHELMERTTKIVKLILRNLFYELEISELNLILESEKFRTRMRTNLWFLTRFPDEIKNRMDEVKALVVLGKKRIILLLHCFGNDDFSNETKVEDPVLLRESDEDTFKLHTDTTVSRKKGMNNQSSTNFGEVTIGSLTSVISRTSNKAADCWITNSDILSPLTIRTTEPTIHDYNSSSWSVHYSTKSNDSAIITTTTTTTNFSSSKTNWLTYLQGSITPSFKPYDSSHGRAKSVTYGYNRTISIPNKTSISSEDAVPATPPDTHPKTDKAGHREDSHGSWVVGRVAGHRLQDLIDRSFAHLPTRREAAFFIVNNMARLNNITFKSGLRVQQLQGVDTGHLLRHGMPIRSSTIHANITFTIPVEVDGPMRVSRVNGALAASFVTLGGHHTLPHSFLFMGPVTAAARIRVRNEINGLDLVLFSKSVALTSSATRQVLRQPITFKQVSVQRLFFGTGRVRDVTLEDLVTLNHPAIITGRKIFQDVKVREGDTRAATLSVHYINDVNVTDLFANSLTTNPETKQVVYGPIIFMNLMVMGKLITSNGLGVHSNSGMQSLHIKRIAARMLYRDKDGQLASNLLLKGRASVKDLAFRDSLDSVTASFYDGGWLLKTTPQSFSGRVILAHVTSGAATVASGAKIQEVDISRLLTATIKLNENAAVAFPVKLSGNMWAARAWVGGAVQGWNLTSEVILQNSSDVVFMAHKTFSDDFHVSGALTAASLRGMAASSLCGENSQKNFDILGAVQLKNPVRTDSVYLGQHVVTKGTVDDYWLLNQHVVLPQNITFYKVKANHIKADSVNGVDVAKLSAVLLRRTCKSGNRQMMTGSFFAPLLVVHSLFTPGISTSSLNSRPLSDINNLFTRDGQQTIKGHWTLQQVQNLESLVTFGHTNGIQMTDFCMIQKPCIITARKIFAHDLTIKKDLHVEPGRTVQGVDVSEAFNQAINGTTCGHVPGVTTFNGSLTASRLTVNGLVNGFKVSSKDVLTGSGAQVMSGQMNITKEGMLAVVGPSILAEDGLFNRWNLSDQWRRAFRRDQDNVVQEMVIFPNLAVFRNSSENYKNLRRLTDQAGLTRINQNLNILLYNTEQAVSGMVHELWGWRSVQTLRSTIARLVPLWMMDDSDGVLSSCPEYMAVISGSGNTKLLIYSYDQRKFINTGMVLRGSCTRAVAGYKTRGENYVITAHTCTSNRSHSTSTTIGSFHQGTAIQEAVQVWRITTHGPQHFQRIGTGALDVQVAEVGQRICLVVAAAIGNGTLVYCSRGSRNTFSGSQHLETGCPKKISVVLHRDSRGRLVTLLAVVGQDRNALHDSALTLWVHDAEQDNFIQVERAPLRGVQWVDMIVHGADLFLAVASRGFTGDTTGKVIVYWVNLHGDLLPLQYFGSLRKTFQTAATPEKLYSPRPQPLLHRLQTLAVQLPLETHFVAMPSGPLYLFVMSEQGNVTRFAQKGVHRFAMEGLYHAPGRQQVQVWLCEEKDGEVSIKMAMSGSQCRQEQCSGPGHMDVELLEANFKPGPPSIH